MTQVTERAGWTCRPPSHRRFALGAHGGGHVSTRFSFHAILCRVVWRRVGGQIGSVKERPNHQSIRSAALTQARPLSTGRARAALAAVLAASACAVPDTTPEPGAVWTVSAEPSLRIGGYDERAGHQLYRVLDAVRLSTGGLAVATLAGTDIRYFDDEGRLLATAGGRGAGPAEFQRLQAVARSGDTLLVYTGDPAIARIAPDGRVISKALLRGVSALPRCRTGTGRRVLLSDGRLLMAHAPASAAGCPRPRPGSAQDSTVAVLWDPGTGVLDSLGAFAPEDRVEAGLPPFGNVVLLAATRTRVYVGSSDADSIAVFDLHGNRTATWRVDARRMPTSHEVRAQARPGEAPVPDHYPLLGNLIGDEAGNLWVLHYPPLEVPLPSHALAHGAVFVESPDSFRWTVLGPSGDVVGQVRTPTHWQILEISADAIVALEHDSLEVETVSVYRLNRGGPF
jgi:hypothetical protein